jgi:hypothetical protein
LRSLIMWRIANKCAWCGHNRSGDDNKNMMSRPQIGVPEIFWTLFIMHFTNMNFSFVMILSWKILHKHSLVDQMLNRTDAPFVINCSLQDLMIVKRQNVWLPLGSLLGWFGLLLAEKFSLWRLQKW